MGKNSTAAGAFTQTLRVWADQNLSPAAMAAQVAGIAIQARDDLIAADSAPPLYTTTVNGRTGVREDQVKPGGAIVYDFSMLPLAVAYALAYARNRSPVRSGRFRDAWTVLVSGRPWPGKLEDIPADQDAWIVNPEPYARKIESGGEKTKVPPGVARDSAKATAKQFPSLRISSAFLNLPAGLIAGRGAYRLVATAVNRKGVVSKRSDRQRNAVLTYPAIIIRGQSAP